MRIGYFGVFEAEFIRLGDERLLIDFNPRFFGQMGFDVARGLPIVGLAYEAALGGTQRVTQLLQASASWSTANQNRTRVLPPDGAQPGAALAAGLSPA